VNDDRAAIDEAVQRAELRLRRGDGGCDRARVGKVQADGERIFAYCGLSRIERIGANIGQSDLGAFGRQQLGGCATHAPAGASDENAASLMSARSGNFAGRQRRVRRAGEELADGIPLKAFQNEARRAPLAAQERMTRSVGTQAGKLCVFRLCVSPLIR
jgi:hypothetical protein